MTSSIQELTPERNRSWATALLVAVMCAHVVVVFQLLLGHFRDIFLDSAVHHAYYNLIASWLVLGTWKLRWRLAGATAATVCFAASYYWAHLRTEAILGLPSIASPSFASKLSVVGSGLLITSLPYVLALRYRFDLRRGNQDQPPLQFSILGIVYITALALMALVWIDVIFWVSTHTWVVGAVTGLYALPGVVACWAALGRHRPWLAVVLALVFGGVFDYWWLFLQTGKTNASMPRMALLVVMLLLGTFLPLRACGYRLVPRRELRNAPARPSDDQ